MDSDIVSQFPAAPHWALFAGELGKFLIYGGIALFAVSILLWALLGRRPALVRAAAACFFGGCLAVLGSMVCLVALFVGNQFEFQYVFSHGDAATAIYYKVAGVWTAQQGSFLLWACTSAVFGMLAFWSARQYRRWYVISFSAFLGSLCGILAYDSPFNLIKDATVNGVVKLPPGGTGMTPALQNYWVVIHPPTIFTGFGSLTVMFALAVAALVSGNVTDWVKIVRPWALVSASILGLGLCMGGMWAYETQGWGGFWGWDPVENVSFVPWLFTVTLIHGIIVQVTKNRWVRTNLLLAGMPFLTFVYGTFLTRSGLLDKLSVHSFAEMQHSSLVVLVVFLILTVLAFFTLFGYRMMQMRKAPEQAKKDEPGFDREGMYRAGMLLISLMAIGIAIGMSWPWFSALTTGTGSAIEEKQYHMVLVWFFIPILLLMGIAPFVGWRKIGAKEIFNRLVSVLSLAAGLTGFALVAIQNPKIGVHMERGTMVAMPFHHRMLLMPWMAVLIFTCIFVVVANTWRVVELFKRSKLGVGGFIAHIGIAVLMAGMVISRGFEQKDSGIVIPNGGPTRILGYSIEYDKMKAKSVDDRDGKVLFTVDGPDGQHFTATPGLFYYLGDEGTPKPMVWPYVVKYFAHDFYMAMGDPELYAWDKPLVFKEGETHLVKNEDPNDPGMAVTYKKFVMQGNPGEPGTWFGAQLHINDRGTEYDVMPREIIGESGSERVPQVGRLYRMALMGVNPADRSVTLQLMFATPLYPIVLFYKPMTILVWLGTAIMTLGGLLTAFSRRLPRAKAAQAAEGSQES